MQPIDDIQELKNKVAHLEQEVHKLTEPLSLTVERHYFDRAVKHYASHIGAIFCVPIGICIDIIVPSSRCCISRHILSSSLNLPKAFRVLAVSIQHATQDIVALCVLASLAAPSRLTQSQG